jgi:hypothetical protein
MPVVMGPGVRRDDTNLKTSPRAASAPRLALVDWRASHQIRIGFCRKGLSQAAEIQLAVSHQPVYNPAVRYSPDK